MPRLRSLTINFCHYLSDYSQTISFLIKSLTLSIYLGWWSLQNSFRSHQCSRVDHVSHPLTLIIRYTLSWWTLTNNLQSTVRLDFCLWLKVVFFTFLTFKFESKQSCLLLILFQTDQYLLDFNTPMPLSRRYQVSRMLTSFSPVFWWDFDTGGMRLRPMLIVSNMYFLTAIW